MRRLGFQTEGKLFDYRIGEYLSRDPFYLGLRRVLFQSIFQGQQEILTLPYVGNAAIFHSPQCIRDCLPLGIQHRSFQRDIDMSLHSA